MKAFSYQRKIIEGMSSTDTSPSNISSKVSSDADQVDTKLAVHKNRSSYEDTIVHRQDPSGKSMAVGVEFFLAKGSASVVCYNFTEESNIQSGLDVSISNKEFDDWLLSFN